MYPIYHFIFTAIASILLLPILRERIILFWLGSFFVDADHYVWEALKNKSLSFKKAYSYCKKKTAGEVYSFDFHVFHLIEFWIIMAIWGYFSEFGFVIFAGLTFHMVIDLIYAIMYKKYHGRPICFIEWLNYSPSSSTKI